MDNIEDINSNTREEVIAALIEKVKAYYVFPDLAEQINAHLNKCMQEGVFDDLNSGSLFALALTMHLQEVNQDEHLWVRWHAQPLPEESDALRLDPNWQAARKEEAQQDHYGFHKLERLPGNIGYIDIRYFHRPAWGGEVAVDAMKYLSSSSAAIIDLRNCIGGYPGMVALVSTYLFDEEPLLLNSIYWRDDDLTQQYWTLPYVPGRRFPDTPVFVLTSKKTFSAGEELAFILQSRKRALIIGEKTDGGAHPGVSYRISPHFEAFIPIGRGISPITGSDWEGIGITPDIQVSAEQSFNCAYQQALQSVIVELKDKRSEPQQQLVEEVQITLKKLNQA
jgi:C-terminal processing protease CtpA/Prc